MKQIEGTTKVAGVDVGKRWLDAAIVGEAAGRRFKNTVEGVGELLAWLSEQGVRRVGMEASGGYERLLYAGACAAGLEVVLHQPLEVRLFARLRRRKAKNDRLDAALIAAATAQVDTVRAAADARLAALAERLGAYEQVCDQAAQLKTFLEHVTLEELKRQLQGQVRALTALKRRLAAQILAQIKAHADLAHRLQLLTSLPGVGPIVGASLVIRMPELGAMNRGQPAALIGVAPYDRDSGQWKGQRAIAGGRTRPRRMLYLAALAAKRSSPTFKAFALRLASAGKPPKVVVTAVMRKLIEAANLVLARDQPWIANPTT